MDIGYGKPSLPSASFNVFKLDKLDPLRSWLIGVVLMLEHSMAFGHFWAQASIQVSPGVRHGAGTMVQASAGQWRRGVWEETPSTFPGAGGTRAEPRRVDAAGALLRSRGWGMMWGFPKSWGYPWIIHWNGSFRYKSSSLGHPLYGNPHVLEKKV